METIPFKTFDRIFEELEARASVANLSNDQYMAYERSLKAQRDYENTLNTEYRTGHAEGRAEGKRNQLEMTVRNLRDMGLPDEKIAIAVDAALDIVSAIR